MHDQAYTPLSTGITLIDTGFMRPRFAASYLMVEDGRAAFIETGAAESSTRLLEALRRANLDVGDVDYVVVTHVHLDHAGAAGTTLAELPNAKLVVHPRGARHMIDPSRLVQGAMAVYGEEVFRKTYGEVTPVAAERVIEAPDDFVLELSGRPLRFLDAPGHARHHACVWDEASSGVFTGDAFGLAFPDLTTPNGPFIFPTTTPVQFDPVAMHATIDRLLSLEPQWMYLTHFGRIGDAATLAQELHELIDASVALAERTTDDNRSEQLRSGLMSMLLQRLQAKGCELPEDDCRAALQLDVDLDAQGLELWLQRREGS